MIVSISLVAVGNKKCFWFRHTINFCFIFSTFPLFPTTSCNSFPFFIFIPHLFPFFLRSCPLICLYFPSYSFPFLSVVCTLMHATDNFPPPSLSFFFCFSSLAFRFFFFPFISFSFLPPPSCSFCLLPFASQPQWELCMGTVQADLSCKCIQQGSKQT